MIVLSTTDVTVLLDLLEGRPPQTPEEQALLHDLYVRLHGHRMLVTVCQDLADRSGPR